MSRIGRMPVPVPAGVTVTLAPGGAVTVKGPRGALSQTLPAAMAIEQRDGALLVTRPSDSREHRALHGLTRTLLNNMVVGVTQGYSKELEVNGVGFRAQMQGKQLVLNVGFSHPVTVDEIPGITIELKGQNGIVVSGCDKQKVGQFAADLRMRRPPEPYKGKGIKYVSERIRRKEGKAGGKKK